MLFKLIIVDGKEYKLRLGIKDTIALEKKIGTNPINKLIEMQNGQLPSMEFIKDVLQASLQKFNKGMTEAKTEDLMDTMVDEGYDSEGFLNLMMEIMEVSGFFKKETLEAAEKEATAPAITPAV